MILFRLKKILPRALFPVPLCIESLTMALCLLWFTDAQTAGKVVATAGTLFLVLASCAATANRLLGALEYRYPAHRPRAETEPRPASPAFRTIVVLGSGYDLDPRLPPTSQVGDAFLSRFTEAVRLQRLYPDCRIIVSMGRRAESAQAREMLEGLGIVFCLDPAVLGVVAGARDTDDEARALQPMVGAEPFLLVTSASHMPRAMLLFERQGMTPTPCPCGHLVKRKPRSNARNLMPNASGLRKAERTVYEWLGILWATVRPGAQRPRH